jgi:hypothetical protein
MNTDRYRRFAPPLAALVGAAILMALPARAGTGGRTKAVRETVEYVMGKFGRTAVREGAETLARRVETLAARHGDEAFQAIKKVGPQAFHLVEEAGAHAKQAVSAMARYGEHGATWIAARPKGMQLYLKFGEEGAATLVKHKAVAEGVLERFGEPALKALQAANPQNGRRLAMLLEGGELAAIGRTPELLEIVGKFGDRAMDFVWAHRGALVTTAMLTAFLRNPEPFINGTKDLAQIAGETVVKPVLAIPASVATEVARGTNWTVIFLVTGAFGILCLAAKYLLCGRSGLSVMPIRSESAATVGGDFIQAAEEARVGSAAPLETTVVSRHPRPDTSRPFR